METALKAGRVDWRSLKDEITYKDFLALVGHVIKRNRELAGEDERELTAGDLGLLFGSGDPYFKA